MAQYHLSVKTISRSGGRSATGAAAYRVGCEITDERTGIVHDYERKRGVVSADLVLPEQAPEWARDRAALWNAAELAEKRVNSVVAREFEIALPAELTAAQRRDLAIDFAQELVDRHGLAADVAIHAPGREGDQRNHHAHILCTTRTLEPEGFTKKTRELDKLDSSELLRWRERFAEIQNERLRDYGHSARVDHRSLREQGIDREPTRHLGVAANAMERRGIQTDIGDVNRRIEQAFETGRAARVAALERDRSILDLESSIARAVAERDRMAELTPAPTRWGQYKQLQQELVREGSASIDKERTPERALEIGKTNERTPSLGLALGKSRDRDLSRSLVRDLDRGIER